MISASVGAESIGRRNFRQSPCQTPILPPRPAIVAITKQGGGKIGV
jgi:secreted PhoX family phosphatase